MKKMKRTPKLLIFSMWLLNNYIENEPDIHKAAKTIADTSAYNRLSRLARTVEEAEVIKRPKRNKKRSQSRTVENRATTSDDFNKCDWLNEPAEITSSTIYQNTESDIIPEGEPVVSGDVKEVYKEVFGYDPV